MIKWLPVNEALQLVPAEERDLLKQEALHAMNGFGACKPAFRPFPLLKPTRLYQRLFVDPSLNRLRNLLESYYQEMWHFEAVVNSMKVPGFHHHFQAMARLLKVSRDAVQHGDVEYGWGAYDTAHRIESLIYFKMMSEGQVRVLQEYAAAKYRSRANNLLLEGQGKLSGWRLTRMQKLLYDRNKQLRENIPVADLLLAQKNMSEHFENTYLRLKIISRQIRMLEMIAGVALAIWIGLLTFTQIFDESQVTSTLSLSVLALLFGTLGACISGILRLEKRPVNQRIPGQLESKVFMLARPLVGAVSALGVVFFVLSGLVTIGQESAWLYISAAFAAGFSERLLQFSVDQVGGEEAAGKK
jgi:hypothetical protein